MGDPLFLGIDAYRSVARPDLGVEWMTTLAVHFDQIARPPPNGLRLSCGAEREGSQTEW
jgi:hypothetical protein